MTQLDRKAVHSGLEAQIHLSAYSSRVVPKIPGTVRTVSAYRLVDDTTHQPNDSGSKKNLAHGDTPDPCMAPLPPGGLQNSLVSPPFWLGRPFAQTNRQNKLWTAAMPSRNA